MRDFRAPFAACLALWACEGATSTAPADAASDIAASTNASEASATDSCEALVLIFLGCDAERLQECEREFRGVSAANRSLVDQSVACIEMKFPQLDAGAVLWPGAGASCSPSAMPPLLSSNQAWFHGACQGNNGSVATNLPTDPGFPACGGDAGPPCFFGLDNSGATL
jgi:hypothetical protein